MFTNSKVQKNKSFFSSLFLQKKKGEERIRELLSEINDLHHKYFEKDKKSVNCLIEYEKNNKYDSSGFAKDLREKYMELYSFILANDNNFVEFWKKNFIPSYIIKNLLFYDTVVVSNSSLKISIANDLTETEEEKKTKKKDKKSSFLRTLGDIFGTIKEQFFSSPRKASIFNRLIEQKLLFCLDADCRVILMDKNNSKTVYNSVKERYNSPCIDINVFMPGMVDELEFLEDLKKSRTSNGVVIASFAPINNQVSLHDVNQLDKNGQHFYDVFRSFVNEIKKDNGHVNLKLSSYCKGMYNFKGFLKKYSLDSEMRKYFKQVIYNYCIPMIVQNNNEALKNMANIIYHDSNTRMMDFMTSNNSFDIMHTFQSLKTDINVFFEEYIRLLEQEKDKNKQLDAIIRIQDLNLFFLYKLDVRKRSLSISSDLEVKKKELLKKKEKLEKTGGMSRTDFNLHNNYIDLVGTLQQRLNSLIERHNLSSDLEQRREELKLAKQQNVNFVRNNQMQNVNNNIRQNKMINLTNTQNNIAVSQ